MKVCPVCAVEYPDDVKFCPADGQTLRAQSPTTDLVGQVVADRYYVLRKLGEGGMGQVYLAEHVKMGRKDAIKVMNPAVAHDADTLARFNREAANASRIQHPNVCAIYDFGETAEGLVYLAMEFVEGEPLTAILDREGTLALPRGVEITRQVAEALQAAHDMGIVHRDLKPDNVMVSRSRAGKDLVKVVDFGIAKAVGSDGEGQKVTKTGFVVGTPEFMSPEQLSGDALDGRSDVYSLALVCYRMLTGTLPFEGDTAQELMVKRLTEQPLPLADARPDLVFPPGLQPVMDRALARTRADRYSSATVFARDLLAAVGGGVTTQIPATRAQAGARTEVVESRTSPRPRMPPVVRVAKPQRSSSARTLALIGGALVVAGGGTAVAVFLFLGTSTSGGADSSAEGQQPAAAETVATRAGDTLSGSTLPAAAETSSSHRASPPVASRAGDASRDRPTGPRSASVDLALLDARILTLGRNPVANRDELRRLAMDRSLPDTLRAKAASGLAEGFIETGPLDSAIKWADSATRWDGSKPNYRTVQDQLRRQLGRPD